MLACCKKYITGMIAFDARVRDFPKINLHSLDCSEVYPDEVTLEEAMPCNAPKPGRNAVQQWTKIF
jgi:hypothetical protein